MKYILRPLVFNAISMILQHSEASLRRRNYSPLISKCYNLQAFPWHMAILVPRAVDGALHLFMHLKLLDPMSINACARSGWVCDCESVTSETVVRLFRS
jgi:hypothetical protein